MGAFGLPNPKSPRLPVPGAAPSPAAKPSRTWTASVWLGWFGSGTYVPKRTESKRGGGTISATRRSAGTCGSRAQRERGAASAAMGLRPAAVEEEDTPTHAKGWPGPVPGAGRSKGILTRRRRRRRCAARAGPARAFRAARGGRVVSGPRAACVRIRGWTGPCVTDPRPVRAGPGRA
ncbi:hypothetical protein GCM10020295_18130 [Streptomyces cinereospinus]